MKDLKDIMKTVESMFVAGSFAEEGEFSTAREMLAEDRRVLLALRAGKVDPKTLRYALNTATRIKAGIDILYSSEGASALENELGSFTAGLASAQVPHRLIRASGCLKQQIIDYTENHGTVLFVVIESPEDLDGGCVGGDKALAGLWRNLRCPLVVVSEAKA
jgi:hypothetical protein